MPASTEAQHRGTADLNLDADGNIESVFDGAGTLEADDALGEAEGFDRPPVLVS